MPHSYVMTFAPIGSSAVSSGVRLPPQPSRNPLVKRENSSMLHETSERSRSSSAAVLAP